MGAGKTTVGQAVARLCRAKFADLDAAIEQAAGQSVRQIFEAQGEARFRELEVEALPRLLDPGTVVALGGGTSGVLSNRALLSRAAVTVWLDAPFEVLQERISSARGARPLALLRGPDLEQLYASRLAAYAEADYRVYAAVPVEQVVEEVRRIWCGSTRK